MSILSDLSGFISGAKGSLDTWKSIMDDQYITKRIPRIITKVASLLLMFIFLQQYWNILGYFSIAPLPLFDVRLSNGITYIIPRLLFLILILEVVVWPIIIRADLKFNSTYVRFVLMLDDIISIVASASFVAYSLDEFLYFSNYGVIAFKLKYMYWGACIYLMYRFICWVSSKNRNNPYGCYTDFCDSKETYIREDDYVLYYNRLYRIGKILGHNKSEEYFLIGVSYDNKKTIPLETAAQDAQGRLTVKR